jgi:hypothetical protein
MMLTYKKNWKKHFFDVLALAELQKETYTGYYTQSAISAPISSGIITFRQERSFVGRH